MGPKDEALIVKLYWGLGGAAAAQKDQDAAISAFESGLDMLERTTSYGEGKWGETQYSWYLFYKNSIRQDLLPGVIRPVYSEGMVEGLVYLANWYCSNQQSEQAMSAINRIKVVRSDDLEAQSATIYACGQEDN
jgi:hypothetical protein